VREHDVAETRRGVLIDPDPERNLKPANPRQCRIKIRCGNGFQNKAPLNIEIGTPVANAKNRPDLVDLATGCMLGELAVRIYRAEVRRSQQRRRAGHVLILRSPRSAGNQADR